MGNEEIRDYLKNLIEDKSAKVGGAAKIVLSMVAGSEITGRIEPIDLQGFLSCYRGLIETATLLKAYNDNFYDENSREIQQYVAPLLDKTEREMNSLLEDMINKIHGIL